MNARQDHEYFPSADIGFEAVSRWLDEEMHNKG
jgi:hypothetical protein